MAIAWSCNTGQDYEVSLEKLRGIPNDDNNNLYLRQIRKVWYRFYRTTPNPTRQQLLDKATEIDKQFGNQFLPKK